MSSLQKAPENFSIYNSLQSKELAIVVDIEGLDYLTSRQIYQQIRYGDPINYGDPDIVYGGLRPVGLPGERGQKSLLNLDSSSLTISQRLEPEQGRASVSTLSMGFNDKDGYMTRACSPGVIIPDIMNRPVKIWLGYIQNSFPEEYYVVWRGRVTQLADNSGVVNLQFSDANFGRRKQIFFSGQTVLSSGIDDNDTTIPVVSNTDFINKILGPDGVTYDQDIKCYIKIDDEFIEYQQTGQEAVGFGTNQFVNVLRGQRGTDAVAHDPDAEVEGLITLQAHGIDIALKVMLSGWGGYYETSQEISGFNNTNDPTVGIVPNSIVFPYGIDAIRDYGLQSGDYINITGSGVPANNKLVRATGFVDSLGPNRVVTVDETLTDELSTTGVAALRSQYDVYPIKCGCQLKPAEVDVGGHLYYRNTFLSSTDNTLKFPPMQTESSAKTWLESEIYLPMTAYSLTRQGKLSMGYTKPPFADDRTIVLDENNVIDPNTISPSRGLNNRKFFNEIQWEYDYRDDGVAASKLIEVDTNSLNTIGISSVLPMKSKGSRTEFNFTTIAEKRDRFLLNRYAMGAILIPIKTNFGTGNQIECGDVVVLKDEGNLKIPNYQTGERNMGVQLFEVINRDLNLRDGSVKLTLQSGVGANVDDRFATIAPSSLVTIGSTTTRVRITESFGELFPGREQDKWTNYFGYNIIIHSPNFTDRYAERLLIGLAADDNHALVVSPALPFTPQVDDIVELAPYPDNTDANDQSLPKAMHGYVNQSVSILTGVSVTQFNVSLLKTPYFILSRKIIVRNDDWSNESPEVSILSVVGTLVTVDSSLGFTPATNDIVEFVPYLDSGGAYKMI